MKKHARTATGSRRPLPDYIQRALRTGERTWETNGYSRNHLVFSIGLSMFQNGWTKDEFMDEILSPNNLAGEKYQDMYEPKARKALETDWNRIADFVADNPPEKGTDIVRKRLGHTLDAVMAMKWAGRTGNTDRHVLLTMLTLSMDVGTYTPAFGVRTLAIATNLTAKTVMKSLARLRQAGHLEEITPATHTKSARYGFTIVPVYNTPLTSYSGSESSGVLKTEVTGHDLFTRGALGNTALRLWTQLEYGKPYTAKQMAEVTGLGEDVCRKAAHKLVEVGVADSDNGRPMKFTFYDESDGDPAMLDMLLMELETWQMPDTSDLSGTSGKGEKRAAIYEREQAARKLEFSHYDREANCFVDPATGEVVEIPQVLLSGSQRRSESLPDFLPAWDASDPFKRSEAA